MPSSGQDASRVDYQRLVSLITDKKASTRRSLRPPETTPSPPSTCNVSIQPPQSIFGVFFVTGSLLLVCVVLRSNGSLRPPVRLPLLDNIARSSCKEWSHPASVVSVSVCEVVFPEVPRIGLLTIHRTPVLLPIRLFPFG
ncbi:hypothetical protein BDN70DRAFT_934931 [Pholiota conissans]|uniref:Uncharacterized protein n=1 Tax=Pholiota conissans TaxID=109636 RepID=A0A9P5YW45_9AGAR|nr:hypothetical protein BDN70DRAFT_934931 [Pholiota conissans]